MAEIRGIHLEPIDIPEKGALLEEFPEILSGGGKALLYVGASEYRAYMLDDLVSWGWKPVILEAWPANAAFLRQKFPVIEGDVAKADIPGHFAAAIWWHGPEHLDRQSLPATLAKLEAAADLVVLGCPSGPAPQGEAYGNPFEAHRWTVAPGDLAALGYSIRTDPRPGQPDNILAWRRTR